MKKLYIMIMLLAAVLCAGAAAGEEEYAFLGEPFPDFTATDTEGNTFPLSEALKDHEAVPDTMPRDSSTRAFPVSQAWGIYPEGSGLKKFLIHTDSSPEPFAGYIVPDELVRLRIEITAGDDVSTLLFVDTFGRMSVDVGSMLDQEKGIIETDQPVPGPSDYMHYADCYLYDPTLENNAGRSARIFLVRDAAYISELINDMENGGIANPRWEYTDDTQAEKSGPQAYIIHVVDQYNDPVEEVAVNFCTDTACVPRESDEEGEITFSGEPDIYHIQIIDAPEGYSYDEDYELYTTREYSEWILRVRKD